MIGQPGKVKFVKGSILQPHNAGLRFILSFAGMNGQADGELHDLFAKKWVKVRQDVKGWFGNKDGKYKLGAINNTAVQSDLWILHLLVKDEKDKVNAEGLTLALKEVQKLADYEHSSIAISELMVKEYPKLKKAVEECLVAKGVSVTYYDE